MHSAAKIENARVAYLARLYEQNATMRKEINKLHAQNQHQDPGAEVTISQEKGTALFKNMKITDLPYIETITGRKIEIQKQANGQSSFSMKLPNHLLSSGYYRGSNNKVKADLMGIAGAIRASGSETITMKIQHKDQEKGMELIRAAYEASIEAGFDPKKITLELNGKPVSASEAFATCPSRLNAANSQASKNSTATEAAEKAATGIGYKRFKDDLNNGRLADATAKAEARVAEERAMGKDPMLRNTNP